MPSARMQTSRARLSNQNRQKNLFEVAKFIKQSADYSIYPFPVHRASPGGQTDNNLQTKLLMVGEVGLEPTKA